MRGSVSYVVGSLCPTLRRTTATTTFEIISVDIMPSGRVTLKIVLVYRKPKIPVAEEVVLYDKLDKIIYYSHETIVIGDFKLSGMNWATREAQGRGGRMLRLVNDNQKQYKARTNQRAKHIRSYNIDRR